MAEKSVRIDGTISAMMMNPSVAIYQVGNPSITNGYVFSRAEQPGVVAAHNFMSLFNPVGSGKTLSFAGAFISTFAVADIATSALSMRGYRITAASGGTLALASEIGKFDTTKPDPVAEIRHGTVTATLGAALFNSPPFVGSAKGSSPFVHMVPIPMGVGGFMLQEGEGIVLRTEAGDVDTRWNLSLAWGEI